jgi:hypothetical protein
MSLATDSQLTDCLLAARRCRLNRLRGHYSRPSARRHAAMA